MNSKEKTIRYMTRRMRRIINKHIRIEKLPVSVGGNIVLSPGEVHSIQQIGDNKGVNTMPWETSWELPGVRLLK
jgi:hypothetical protein